VFAQETSQASALIKGPMCSIAMANFWLYKMLVCGLEVDSKRTGEGAESAPVTCWVSYFLI
jgi:hypothetical protein